MINFHIFPDGDGWTITTEGGGHLEGGFETKERAVTVAVQFLSPHGGSLKTHRADGAIEEERTWPPAGATSRA